MVNSATTRFLESQGKTVLVLYASTLSFATYFCMYAFRKPFAAGTFEDPDFVEAAGFEFKTALVISQIVGYALSKYAGIKLCSETTRARRAVALITCIGLAELALLLFAILPGPWKILAIFLNGLPLGIVWGLVVSYLEGRRTSELLLAALSCSFIVSSGVVKDVGRHLLTSHEVSEAFMPALTGLLFIVPFVVCVWFLDQLPDPDKDDIEARVERQPMNAVERVQFVRKFLPGLVFLLSAYFILTAYRDFRDNYGVEVFAVLGYGETPGIFSLSEGLVAVGVLVSLGLLFLIRDNRLGLLAAYALMIGGLALLGVGTLLLDAGYIDGLTWMICTGLGSYLAYVPYGSLFFDRLLASTRTQGTAVFAIYVADAIGYTGSVGVQLYKDFAHSDVSRFGFLRDFTYVMSVMGVVLLVASAIYFLRQTPRSGDSTRR
jgi:hypothetical protein